MRLARSPPLPRRSRQTTLESSSNLTDESTDAPKPPQTAEITDHKGSVSVGDSCECPGGFGEAVVEETGIIEGKRRNAGKATQKTGENAEMKDGETQKQSKPDSVIESPMEGTVSKTYKNHETGDQHGKNLHIHGLDMSETNKVHPNTGRDSEDVSTPPTDQVINTSANTTPTGPILLTILESSHDTNGGKGEDTPEVRRLNSGVYKPWGSRSTNVDVSADPQLRRQDKERVEEQEQAICKGGPGKLICGIQVKEGDDTVECE